MDKTKDVIISESLEGIGTDAFGDYLAHAVCTGGSCKFVFNGKGFELHEGDLMIVRKGKLIENIRTSEDFKVKVLFATTSFIELSTPMTNYGMRGSLALFFNPVMRLTPEQYDLCVREFNWIEYRLNQTDNNFYKETLRNAVQSAILDFFEFHSKNYGESKISTQNTLIMSKFLDMLENGDYRHDREVTYYADALCVTAKYLSEISKKVSGFTANYWINRYTVLDISRHLRNKSLSFVQISDMFGFSSPAYFSRYVQHNLGVTPSEYRE